jgi:hypothetical protein
VEFIVQYPGRRRHPLHIARPDHAAVAGRIAVRDFALVDDRDGLEAAVRVLPDSPRLLRCRKIRRPSIVEHQEGRQLCDARLS